MHSIVVQSPYLKDFLKQVLTGYPGVTVGLDRLEFAGRFEPLIHRWKELNAALDELKTAAEAITPASSTTPETEPIPTIGGDPVIVTSEIASKHINGDSTPSENETKAPQSTIER